MSTFVLVYRAPKDYTPGDTNVAAAWQSFFDNLGSHLVDAGNPVFSRTTLGYPESDSDLGGYSIITAPDANRAAELAADCPMLQTGGGVEIGELTLLSPTSATTTADDHAKATGLTG